MDYMALSETVVFAECETRRCVIVAIVNDITLERVEAIHINLERTSNLDRKITLSPVFARINIITFDGKLTMTQVRFFVIDSLPCIMKQRVKE